MTFIIFKCPLLTFLKKWTLESLDNWLLSNWISFLYWKGQGTTPSPSNCSNDSGKLLPLFISISWPSLVTWWVLVQKIYLKMHPVSCSDTHHDVTDLVNHGMVKNRKTWISWEQNITFLRNKKKIHLPLQMTHFEKFPFCSGGNL